MWCDRAQDERSDEEGETNWLFDAVAHGRNLSGAMSTISDTPIGGLPRRAAARSSETLLHFAVRCKRVNVVTQLLRLHPDLLEEPDETGRRPLDVATEAAQKEPSSREAAQIAELLRAEHAVGVGDTVEAGAAGGASGVARGGAGGGDSGAGEETVDIFKLQKQETTRSIGEDTPYDEGEIALGDSAQTEADPLWRVSRNDNPEEDVPTLPLKDDAAGDPYAHVTQKWAADQLPDVTYQSVKGKSTKVRGQGDEIDAAAGKATFDAAEAWLDRQPAAQLPSGELRKWAEAVAAMFDRLPRSDASAPLRLQGAALRAEFMWRQAKSTPDRSKVECGFGPAGDSARDIVQELSAADSRRTAAVSPAELAVYARRCEALLADAPGEEHQQAFKKARELFFRQLWGSHGSGALDSDAKQYAAFRHTHRPPSEVYFEAEVADATEDAGVSAAEVEPHYVPRQYTVFVGGSAEPSAVDRAVRAAAPHLDIEDMWSLQSTRHVRTFRCVQLSDSFAVFLIRVLVSIEAVAFVTGATDATAVVEVKAESPAEDERVLAFEQALLRQLERSALGTPAECTFMRAPTSDKRALEGPRGLRSDDRSADDAQHAAMDVCGLVERLCRLDDDRKSFLEAALEVARALAAATRSRSSRKFDLVCQAIADPAAVYALAGFMRAPSSADVVQGMMRLLSGVTDAEAGNGRAVNQKDGERRRVEFGGTAAFWHGALAAIGVAQALASVLQRNKRVADAVALAGGVAKMYDAARALQTAELAASAHGGCTIVFRKLLVALSAATRASDLAAEALFTCDYAAFGPRRMALRYDAAVLLRGAYFDPDLLSLFESLEDGYGRRLRHGGWGDAAPRASKGALGGKLPPQDVAESLCHRASLLLSQGRPLAARGVLERAAALYAEELGDPDSSMLDSLRDLMSAAKKIGDASSVVGDASSSAASSVAVALAAGAPAVGVMRHVLQVARIDVAGFGRFECFDASKGTLFRCTLRARGESSPGGVDLVFEADGDDEGAFTRTVADLLGAVPTSLVADRNIHQLVCTDWRELASSARRSVRQREAALRGSDVATRITSGIKERLDALRRKDDKAPAPLVDDVARVADDAADPLVRPLLLERDAVQLLLRWSGLQNAAAESEGAEPAAVDAAAACVATAGLARLVESEEGERALLKCGKGGEVLRIAVQELRAPVAADASTWLATARQRRLVELLRKVLSRHGAGAVAVVDEVGAVDEEYHVPKPMFDWPGLLHLSLVGARDEVQQLNKRVVELQRLHIPYRGRFEHSSDLHFRLKGVVEGFRAPSELLAVAALHVALREAGYDFDYDARAACFHCERFDGVDTFGFSISLEVVQSTLHGVHYLCELRRTRGRRALLEAVRRELRDGLPAMDSEIEFKLPGCMLSDNIPDLEGLSDSPPALPAPVTRVDAERLAKAAANCCMDVNEDQRVVLAGVSEVTASLYGIDASAKGDVAKVLAGVAARRSRGAVEALVLLLRGLTSAGAPVSARAADGPEFAVLVSSAVHALAALAAVVPDAVLRAGGLMPLLLMAAAPPLPSMRARRRGAFRALLALVRARAGRQLAYAGRDLKELDRFVDSIERQCKHWVALEFAKGKRAADDDHVWALLLDMVVCVSGGAPAGGSTAPRVALPSPRRATSASPAAATKTLPKVTFGRQKEMKARVEACRRLADAAMHTDTYNIVSDEGEEPLDMSATTRYFDEKITFSKFPEKRLGGALSDPLLVTAVKDPAAPDERDATRVPSAAERRRLMADHSGPGHVLGPETVVYGKAGLFLLHDPFTLGNLDFLRRMFDAFFEVLSNFIKDVRKHQPWTFPVQKDVEYHIPRDALMDDTMKLWKPVLSRYFHADKHAVLAAALERLFVVFTPLQSGDYNSSTENRGLDQPNLRSPATVEEVAAHALTFMDALNFDFVVPIFSKAVYEDWERDCGKFNNPQVQVSWPVPEPTKKKQKDAASGGADEKKDDAAAAGGAGGPASGSESDCHRKQLEYFVETSKCARRGVDSMLQMRQCFRDHNLLVSRTRAFQNFFDDQDIKDMAKSTLLRLLRELEEGGERAGQVARMVVKQVTLRERHAPSVVYTREDEELKTSLATEETEEAAAAATTTDAPAATGDGGAPREAAAGAATPDGGFTESKTSTEAEAPSGGDKQAALAAARSRRLAREKQLEQARLQVEQARLEEIKLKQQNPQTPLSKPHGMGDEALEAHVRARMAASGRLRMISGALRADVDDSVPPGERFNKDGPATAAHRVTSRFVRQLRGHLPSARRDGDAGRAPSAKRQRSVERQRVAIDPG